MQNSKIPYLLIWERWDFRLGRIYLKYDSQGAKRLKLASQNGKRRQQTRKPDIAYAKTKIPLDFVQTLKIQQLRKGFYHE